MILQMIIDEIIELKEEIEGLYGFKDGSRLYGTIFFCKFLGEV